MFPKLVLLLHHLSISFFHQNVIVVIVDYFSLYHEEQDASVMKVGLEGTCLMRITDSLVPTQ